MTDRGIVTPEAVVLEFETAGIASRFLASVIDIAVQFVLLIGVLIGAAVVARAVAGLGGLAAAALYLVLFLIVFGYPAAFETLWRGRTLGKAALGLRVVTVEGAPIRFRHAAIRSIFQLIDKFLSSGSVGVLAMLFTRRNQRLGDLVAGTMVLRERTGLRAPSAVTFAPPPGLEAYCASLDVTGLGHEDYGAVRSFLVRAHGLAPHVRAELASQLAVPLAQRMRAVPLPNMLPEVFLGCVAAAYQARAGGARRTAPAFQSVWSDPVGSTAFGHQGGSGAALVTESERGGAGGFAPPS